MIRAELPVTEWSVAKTHIDGHPGIHVYVELKAELDASEVRERLHKAICILHQDYAHVESMLGIHPLHVVVLPHGSFQRYYEMRNAEGADLAHLKPPHMNPSEETLRTLLSMGE